MIRDIRNYKSTNSIAPNAKVRLIVSPKEPFAGFGEYLSRFAFATSYSVKKEALGGNPFMYPGFSMVVEEDVDPSVLLERLLKQKTYLEGEIARSHKILSNPGFLAKAPKEKVRVEEEKLSSNSKLLANVEAKIAEIQK